MARTRFGNSPAPTTQEPRSHVLARMRELMPGAYLPKTDSVLDILLYDVDLHPFPLAYEAVWYDDLRRTLCCCWIDARVLTEDPATVKSSYGDTPYGTGAYMPRSVISGQEMLDEWSYQIENLSHQAKKENSPSLKLRAEVIQNYMVWVAGKRALRSYFPDNGVPEYHVLKGAYGEIPDTGVVTCHLAHDLTWDAALTMVYGIFRGEPFNAYPQNPDGCSLYLCDATRTWAMIRPARGDGSRTVPFQLRGLGGGRVILSEDETKEFRKIVGIEDNNKDLYKDGPLK